MSAYTESYVDAAEHLPEGSTLVLPHIEWDDYEQLLDEIGKSRRLRAAYSEGRLEIVAPLPEHEEYGDVILQLVRVMCRELGVKLETRGSMTIKVKAKGKGVEPDRCFYVTNAEAIIGKRTLDFSVDPPPDIAVEIDVTNESLGKFDIYAALGVPEIWRYDGETTEIYHLTADAYRRSLNSMTFPFLTGDVLSSFLEMAKNLGQDEALDAFRSWVEKKKPR